jgi:thiol-disulfide isomerase/thioredoxin
VWVLLVAVVAALLLGISWTLTNGVFRGTRRLRAEREGVGSTGSVDATGSDDARGHPESSVLAGTTYDGSRGERATLLQFSSAFCAPCRATRRTLAEVARVVPGVTHVEVDAEHHLSLVRDLGVLRTPTTLVLDADGRELTRATGAPRSDQVLAALSAALA